MEKSIIIKSRRSGSQRSNLDDNPTLDSNPGIAESRSGPKKILGESSSSANPLHAKRTEPEPLIESSIEIEQEPPPAKCLALSLLQVNSYRH